jgi:hypothetical protein
MSESPSEVVRGNSTREGVVPQDNTVHVGSTTIPPREGGVPQKSGIDRAEANVEC